MAQSKDGGPLSVDPYGDEEWDIVVWLDHRAEGQVFIHPPRSEIILSLTRVAQSIGEQGERSRPHRSPNSGWNDLTRDGDAEAHVDQGKSPSAMGEEREDV